MINLEPFKHDFERKLIRECAGVDFVLEQRDGRQWYNEVLILDEIYVTTPKKDGPDKVGAAIRWFNFKYAYWQVLLLAHKEGRMLTNYRAAEDALTFARLNCFDIDGSPSHMARALQMKSYLKFNEMVEEGIKQVEMKVFEPAMKN